MVGSRSLRLFLGGLLATQIVRAAITVDTSDASSIKSAASTIAYNLMTYYKGNESGQTPGILPGPPPAGAYYWWEGGALWGTMVDYWHYTEDTTYNNETEYSLVFQAGAPDNSYQSPNWTASLGNDDQGFWGMSAMLAAEVNFQNPASTDPQWLALAQGVFNTQAERWDTQYCNGGLRWQIPLSNNGYDYKNSIANAIFFNLAARLARYTGNTTYAQWADDAFNWTQAVGYIDENWNIYDGAHVEHNCTDINKAQFSYTAAIFIQGAAFMYNYTTERGTTNGTSAALWEQRVRLLTNQTFNVFFPNGYAVEVACELENTNQCTTDMLSFKGYVHRFLAQSTQVATFMHDTIMTVLRTSAAGAVNACDPDGVCGFRWNGTYDGDTGAGQEMNALGALMSLLVDHETVASPLTNQTGGTSVGDPSAGSSATIPTSNDSPITTGDRAGAGFLTAFILAICVSTLFWMSSGANEAGMGP